MYMPDMDEAKDVIRKTAFDYIQENESLKDYQELNNRRFD